MVEMPLPVSVARKGRQMNHPLLLTPHLQLADGNFHTTILKYFIELMVYGGREWPLKVRTQIQKSISKVTILN